MPIQTDDTATHIAFLSNLCQLLYTYLRQPDSYASGLKNIVFALPTRGRELPDLFWVKSVLEGLKALKNYFRERGISFTKTPVIIFDQASPKEFEKNERYLNAIARECGADIMHLSNRQTVE